MNYSNEASPFQLLNLFSYFLRLTLIRHVHVTASLHLDVFVKLCKGDVATKGGGVLATTLRGTVRVFSN